MITQAIIGFLLCLLYLLGLLLGLRLISRRHALSSSAFFRWMFFGVLFWRLLFWGLSHYSPLSALFLFDPEVFAYSAVAPSLGDMLFHLIPIALWLSLSLRHRLPSKHLHAKTRLRRLLWLAGDLLAASALMGICYLAHRLLLLHTSLDLRISDIFNVTPPTLFLLLAIALINYCIGLCLRQIILRWNLFLPAAWRMGILPQILLLITLLTAASALWINRFSSRQEHIYREALAQKIIQPQNPFFEEQLRQSLRQFRADSLATQMVDPKNFDENQFIAYLYRTYFSTEKNAFLKDYNTQITLCKAEERLLIDRDESIVNCFEYFDQRVQQWGQSTSLKSLFLIRSSIDEWSHLLLFALPEQKIRVFIEFIPRNAMPSLRSEVTRGEYSYAIYKGHELLQQNGPYVYPLRSELCDSNPESLFIVEEEYSHLRVSMENHGYLWISQKVRTPIQQLSVFSYLFLFHFLFFLFIYALYAFPFRKPIRHFSHHLQLLTLTIMLVAFAAIGGISIVYVQNLNRQKNQEFLREKSYSLLLQMETLFGRMDADSLASHSSLRESLEDLSGFYFTDIHLYRPDGRLLASSNPRMHEERREVCIDSSAFCQLHERHVNFLIQKQYTDGQRFYSSFVPFRNYKNELLGYLNLPHTAKQSELRHEISNFLSAFINLYVIILLLTTLSVIFFTEKLTRPIRWIGEQMRQVKMGTNNQKIGIARADEIGDLVSQYNRMIDALAVSADLLAQSERQGAWNEMAKQVAHEIKNPLTPMKLSVQQMRRAHQDQRSDFDERFLRFTDILNDQIDSLSQIASEFAYFAQHTKPSQRPTALADLLAKTVELLDSEHKIHFSPDTSTSTLLVDVDPLQMSRAFLNLLKNALQAIEGVSNGSVDVSIRLLATDDSSTDTLKKTQKPAMSPPIRVDIRNNGPMIPLEIQSKLFQPNFTTKTSGMGLGLAITKNIVEQNGGTISFVTDSGGSCFSIGLGEGEER